jgi:hypothetical protein
MSLYIKRFEFVAADPDNANSAPAWQLQLGQSGLDAFNRPFPEGPVMNMVQAAEAGYDLDKIVAGLNVAALHEVDLRVTDAQIMQTQIETMQTVIDQQAAAISSLQN